MRSILVPTMLVTFSVAALAAPPEGQKLSEIIAKIEQNGEAQYIDEIDWSRRGYYKIEYIRNDGAKVKIRIDPKTGQSVPRRR